MREKDVVFRVKHALTFAARGGMRASLFEDSAEDDADMLLETGVVTIPPSMKPVVVRAIEEWRTNHLWLEHMPDNIK